MRSEAPGVLPLILMAEFIIRDKETCSKHIALLMPNSTPRRFPNLPRPSATLARRRQSRPTLRTMPSPGLFKAMVIPAARPFCMLTMLTTSASNSTTAPRPARGTLWPTRSNMRSRRSLAARYSLAASDHWPFSPTAHSLLSRRFPRQATYLPIQLLLPWPIPRRA